MSVSNSNENRRILYLEHISTVTAKTGIRINVQIDNGDVEMTHEQQTSVWTPTESLELLDDSKITVAIKVGHTIKGVSFRKLEARTEVSSQEAVQSFWDSIDSTSSGDSISRTVNLGHYPVTVTFKFRPSKTFEDTRSAVGKLQREMHSFNSVMTGTTERHIENALKFGVVLAEMDPTSKLARYYATTLATACWNAYVLTPDPLWISRTTNTLKISRRILEVAGGEEEADAAVGLATCETLESLIAAEPPP